MTDNYCASVIGFCTELCICMHSLFTIATPACLEHMACARPLGIPSTESILRIWRLFLFHFDQSSRSHDTLATAVLLLIQNCGVSLQQLQKPPWTRAWQHPHASATCCSNLQPTATQPNAANALRNSNLLTCNSSVAPPQMSHCSVTTRRGVDGRKFPLHSLLHPHMPPSMRGTP